VAGASHTEGNAIITERCEIRLTSLERAAKKVLDELGLSYIEQFPTRSGFLIDFALLDAKVAIETDGPCHLTKDAKRHDRFKDYQLRREGWTVIRVTEEQVNELPVFLTPFLK